MTLARGAVLVVLLADVVLTAAAAAQPDPIPGAIKALLQEHGQASPPQAPLPRKRPDYFGETDVKPTPEAVWAALEGRHSADAGADAYVKWQLISALPPGPEREEATVRRVLALYRRAATPPPNPLMVLRGHSETGRLLDDLMKQGGRAVNDKITEILDRERARGEPIVGYREALLGRLTPSAGRFLLELEELAVRTRLGWGVDDYRDRVVEEILRWHATAGRRELSDVVQAIHRVRDVRSAEYPVALEQYGPVSQWAKAYAHTQGAGRSLDRLIETLNARIAASGR